jgi:ribosomal protein S18 acetylase RimI-like enzyme
MTQTYSPVRAGQYDEFFRLMVEESAGYLETALALMHSDLAAYRRQFEAVGEVQAICLEDEPAGFRWIELRGTTLHLHALVLKPAFQGQGIGTQALIDLETEFAGAAQVIELGVHQSNGRAIALYQKQGYTTTKTLDELGFLVMQKMIGQGK